MIAEAAARLAAFEAVRERAAWGERAFFVDPDGRLPDGACFAAIETEDGPNDRAARLGGGRWRLGLGLPKPLFIARFGQPPKRPAGGGVVAGAWDFTAEDALAPHPVHGWMGWVAVANPTRDTLDALAAWIAAAHGKAMGAARCRIARLEGMRCR